MPVVPQEPVAVGAAWIPEPPVKHPPQLMGTGQEIRLYNDVGGGDDLRELFIVSTISTDYCIFTCSLVTWVYKKTCSLVTWVYKKTRR